MTSHREHTNSPVDEAGFQTFLEDTPIFQMLGVGVYWSTVDAASTRHPPVRNASNAGGDPCHVCAHSLPRSR